VLFDHLLEVHDPEPHAAALNMAIDEALLRAAREPILRIYRWEQPAVSFGYFGKWAEVQRTWPEREAVRRWTGGGIVPHGDDLTYSLIVPRAHPFALLGPLESYRAIHEALAAALGSASLRLAQIQSLRRVLRERRPARHRGRGKEKSLEPRNAAASLACCTRAAFNRSAIQMRWRARFLEHSPGRSRRCRWLARPGQTPRDWWSSATARANGCSAADPTPCSLGQD
jgi:hypothetical protein